MALVCLALAAAPARAQSGRQEYFARQEADQGLLIRVNGFEADYRAVLSEYGGEESLAAAVPGDRIAPRFHYLAPVTQARDLVLLVDAAAVTSRSRFDIELNRITVRDTRSAELARGYRLLAQGLEEEPGTAPATWAAKIYGLDEAARVFEGFGMEELRSWSRFYAAYFVLHRLGDSNTTLDRAAALLRDLQSPRQAPIRLASLRLRAAALESQRAAGQLPPATADDPLQAAWAEVDAQAAALEHDFEQAAARFAMGRDLAGRDLDEQALAQFRGALEIADRIGAGDLGTAVREDMVLILGQQGDASAKGEVLGQIESQLTQSGSSDELAQNLLAQGRLANRTYRPQRAVPPLQQALELEHNSLTRSQIHLELARAWLAAGRLDEALAQARVAVLEPDSGAFKRPSPLLDVNAGIAVMAAVHRQRGQADELREVREAQAHWLGAQAQGADFLFERGLDARGSEAAGRWFAQAASAATGEAAVRQLARLWACALGASPAEACGMQGLNALYRELLAGGVPSRAMEARLAWARLQARQGDAGEARRSLQALVERALFHRMALPGVLDGWVLERFDALSGHYLDPLLAGSDAMASLFAVSQLRRLDGAAQGSHPDLADDNFRELLARCAAPAAGDDAAALARQVDGWLERNFAAFMQQRPELSAAGLRTALARLPDDQALLTWHVTGARAQAWRADAGGVRSIALPDAQGLLGLLNQAREQLPVLEGPAFDALAARLGERLLGPLAQGLPQRLLLLPAGPLLGLTPDAWRLDGAFLAERFEITQMLDLPAAAPVTAAAAPRTVFVAGAPSDYTPDVLQQLGTPADLRAVMDQFVGPGLHVVQGAALLLDEFTDPRYAQAAVLHLALPGVIDLAQPQRSSLELSEPMRGDGRQTLGPEAIAEQPLAADLVWLGQVRIAGAAPRPTSAWLPLAGDFMAAGADQVILGAWPVSAEAAVPLLEAFYRRLRDGQAAPAALRAARLELLRAGDAQSRDWAAVQLYSR